MSRITRKLGIRKSHAAVMAAAAGLSTCVAYHAAAQVTYQQYFDVNGATAGYGVVNNGTYSWDGAFWSTASTGTNTTTNWMTSGGTSFARFLPTVANYTVTVGQSELMVGMYLYAPSEPQGVNLTISQSNSAGALNIPGTVYEGFLIQHAADDLIITAPITGTGGVEQQLSGALSLYGSNTFSGGFETTGGQVTNFNNPNSFGTGAIAFTGASGQGLVCNGGSAITIANTMNFAAGTITNFVANGSINAPGVTFSGSAILSGNISLEGGTNGSFAMLSGNFTGSNGAGDVAAKVTVTGIQTTPGILILSGSNNFSNGLTITPLASTVAVSVKLAVTNDYALGSTNNLTGAGNGFSGNNFVSINGGNGSAGSSASLIANGTFTSARTFELGTGVTVTNGANTNIIDVTAGNTLTLVGSVLDFSGDLTKGTSTGTLQLANPSGYDTSQNTLSSVINVNVLGGALAFGGSSTFTSTPNGPVVSGGGMVAPVLITGSVNISAGAKVLMNPSLPGTGQTNSFNTLTIGNRGVLDIGNHSVVVQNAPNEAVIGKYLSTGYAGGFWNGTSATSGAINSVVAFNDNSGATSVGYGNSNDFTFGGSTSPYAVGGPKALSGNQVVVAPALEGDLLLEGSVGPDDLAFLLNAFGTTGNDWAFGNIDYDAAGSVGPNDLSLLLSNFGHSSSGFAGAKTSAKSLTSTAKPSLVASSSDVAPPPADGIELIVNTSNGDVELEGNLATLTTSVVLTSPGGTLIGGTTFTPAFHALFDTTASNTSGLIDEFNTFANGSTVDGIIDMGNVYNAVQNSEDVQFQFSEKGINRGGLQTGAVFYVTVPEPTTLSLLAVASAGLLGRRRKRSNDGVTDANQD